MWWELGHPETPECLTQANYSDFCTKASQLNDKKDCAITTALSSPLLPSISEVEELDQRLQHTENPRSFWLGGITALHYAPKSVPQRPAEFYRALLGLPSQCTRGCILMSCIQIPTELTLCFLTKRAESDVPEKHSILSLKTQH